MKNRMDLEVSIESEKNLEILLEEGLVKLIINKIDQLPEVQRQEAFEALINKLD